VSDWNDGIIREFRANGGIVGGPFAGSQLLLLTTIGARTGETRVSPVAYADEGDSRILVASKAGESAHPGWYHNLLANPRVHVEAATDDGVDEYDAIASTYPEARREAKYLEILASRPAFAKYWVGMGKVIPLVILTRTSMDR
jgi:deazaflavin-dependent oxidoreductase (nitroreductase family)